MSPKSVSPKSHSQLVWKIRAIGGLVYIPIITHINTYNPYIVSDIQYTYVSGHNAVMSCQKYIFWQWEIHNTYIHAHIHTHIHTYTHART